MKKRCTHDQKETFWVKQKGLHSKCNNCGQWFKCTWRAIKAKKIIDLFKKELGHK